MDTLFIEDLIGEDECDNYNFPYEDESIPKDVFYNRSYTAPLSYVEVDFPGYQGSLEELPSSVIYREISCTYPNLIL